MAPRPFQEKLLDALREDPGFLPHRVVVDHGRPYEPRALPAGFDVGARKCCFANAFRIASSRPSDFAYVEGYTLHAGMPDWLARHGWCVDREGQVVDPTWGADRPLPLAYRGVVLPLEVAEPYAFDYSEGALESLGERLTELFA